jgi:hypothetical protein
VAQIFDYGATVTSITDNGSNAWAVVVGRTPLNGTGTIGVEIWQECPAATAPTSVTVNFSSSNNHAFIISDYTGTSGVGAHNSATGSSTSPAVSVTTGEANGWVVAAIGYAGTGTITATAGTIRTQLNMSVNGDSVAGGDNTSASAGSVTVSGTITSAIWAAVAVEVIPAGAAAKNCTIATQGAGKC